MVLHTLETHVQSISIIIVARSTTHSHMVSQHRFRLAPHTSDIQSHEIPRNSIPLFGTGADETVNHSVRRQPSGFPDGFVVVVVCARVCVGPPAFCFASPSAHGVGRPTRTHARNEFIDMLLHSQHMKKSTRTAHGFQVGG